MDRGWCGSSTRMAVAYPHCYDKKVAENTSDRRLANRIAAREYLISTLQFIVCLAIYTL